MTEVEATTPSAGRGSMLQAYRQRVVDGWKADSAQETAVRLLDSLLSSLRASTSKSTKGVYLYGPVGRGKSQLMGMFMEHAAGIGARRIHMHVFMPELHKRLVAVRVGDPVEQLAKDLALEFRVLGFDEFFVSNLGDGVMLGRLFEFLFREGVVIVLTSNWPIEELFARGRNRERFVPYIRMLKEHLTAVDLGNGQDYRQRRDPRWPLYVLASAQEPATSELQALFDAYAGEVSSGPEASPAGIKAMAVRGRCGWYQFADICEQAFGRLAYLELTDQLDTIVVEGVPELDEEDSDAALRLTTLVDICYERHCRMIVSAPAYPGELYAGGPVIEAFRRVASRLAEMQSWV